MDPRTDLVLAWSFSGPEMIIVLVIALLLFGRKLPEIARGLGSSVKEFRKGMEEDPKQAKTVEAAKVEPAKVEATVTAPAPDGAVARQASPATPSTIPPASAAPAASTPKT